MFYLLHYTSWLIVVLYVVFHSQYQRLIVAYVQFSDVWSWMFSFLINTCHLIWLYCFFCVLICHDNGWLLPLRCLNFGRAGSRSSLSHQATTIGYDMIRVLGTAVVSKMSWQWCDSCCGYAVCKTVLCVMCEGGIGGRSVARSQKRLRILVGYYRSSHTNPLTN